MPLVRDPVHNLIEIPEPYIWDLINTKAFQRLRNIKQLGLTSFIYPSAEHSRFVHSIGVYHLSKRIVENLRKNGAKDISQEQERLIKISALLHDIGHPPLSHTLEEIAKNIYPNSYIKHLQITKELIIHNEEIKNIIGEDSQKVVEILSGIYPEKFTTLIISSQFDADRLDYLLRDSYMSGVEYGIFDLEWILNALHLEYYQGTPVLALDIQKGINVLEEYLLGRYYMYKNVYRLPKVIAIQVVLEKIFKRSVDLYGERSPLSKYINQKNLDIDEFTELTDCTLISDIISLKGKDKILDILIEDYIARRPYIYWREGNIRLEEAEKRLRKIWGEEYMYFVKEEEIEIDALKGEEELFVKFGGNVYKLEEFLRVYKEPSVLSIMGGLKFREKYIFLHRSIKSLL